jgi:uncharacterized coiled-coil protein SlyX|tara:strand:+ start:424 stop:594 length:171 start_codon:yes stop_codon:yes gene_type:complete
MNTFKVRNNKSKNLQKKTNNKNLTNRENKIAQILLEIAQYQDKIKVLTKKLKNLNK